NWFRMVGVFSLLTGPYFSWLLLSVFRPRLNFITAYLGRGLTVTAVAYGALIVFCGLMLILFSEKAAAGDKTGRLGIRLASVFLFAAMGGLFLMNQRHLFVYILILGAAINLVGLCPFCNKRRKALFDGK
ncbi:MAG: hypothetical protein AB7V45_17660, partial [Candidatus Krumholzibacteriia bacterium]